MFIDKALQLLEKVKVLGEAVISEVLNFGGGSNAVNEPVLVINTDETFTGGTSVKVEVKTSEKEDKSNAATLAAYTFAISELTEGKRIVQQPLPYGIKRFMWLEVTPTGTFTAGKLTANIAAAAELP